MGQRLPRANTGFGKLINADLSVSGQAVVDGLTASVVTFPAPPVSVVTLQGTVNNYNTALAASIGGSAVQRAAMHTARQELRSFLRQNAIYVNQVAVSLVNGGDSYELVTELIVGTGYQIGLQPSPAGELPSPVVTKYSSPKRGVLYVLIQKINNARAYIIVYGIEGTDEDTWATTAFPNTRINVLGLQSGQTYKFKVYAQGANPAINFSVLLTQVII